MPTTTTTGDDLGMVGGSRATTTPTVLSDTTATPFRMGLKNRCLSRLGDPIVVAKLVNMTSITFGFMMCK